jgi:small subunit ribosomal protein S20
MANTKSAEKRAREDIVRRARNVAHRSKVRSAVRKVVEAINAGKKTEAVAALKFASPNIVSMARKGIIHNNTAPRNKSRIDGQIKAIM